MSNPKAIRNFASQSAEFLKRSGFDGLSVEWQYPVCPQSNCNGGNKNEKRQFTEFIQVEYLYFIHTD